MIKTIKTLDNKEVLVDDMDYDFINFLYDLYVDKNGYVVTKIKVKNMGVTTGQLHRVIMQPPNGKFIHVDHRDGNKLNNTRSNLRICKHEENMRNRKPVLLVKGKEVSSKYKGVYWNKPVEGWIALIRYEGTKINLGVFDIEIAAANCYNYYANIYHKEFAKLNDCPHMSKEDWIKFKRGTNQTSSFNGVSYSKSERKWLSQICHNYNREVIGRFDSEIEAAIAYDKRAIELKGNKAKLNFLKLHN